MGDAGLGTYPPLDTLKPIAPDLWIVDGGPIRFGPPGLKAAFPTRMTILRLGGRALFVHSPTALTPKLAAEVAAIGSPAWIVGPNRLHHAFVAAWRAAYPTAAVFLPPDLAGRARARAGGPARTLLETPLPWADAVETLALEGRVMTEFVFFHRASRSLILTDLIENFETAKLGSRVMRWVTRLGGVRHPDGSMPRDMRWSFAGRRPALRAAVETMIGWNPERIVLAHGRWYESDAGAELRRAFRWLPLG